MVKQKAYTSRSVSLLSLTLVLGTLGIVYTSLVPMQVASWPEFQSALREALTGKVQDPALITVAQRAIAFLPLGLLVHSQALRYAVRHPRFTALLAILVIALGTEVGQAAFSHRHAFLSDLVIAVAAGLAGILLSHHLFAHLRSWVRRTVARGTTLTRSVLVAVLIGGNLAITSTLFLSYRGANLSGWDCSFPLLLANEATGDRPWQGRIQGLAIYARELNASEVDRLSRLPMTSDSATQRRHAGAQVFYHFRTLEDGRAAQLIPGGPTLDLHLNGALNTGALPGQDALKIRRGSRLCSDGPAVDLCRAIMTSGAFSVEVLAASSNLSQGGLARLVSQSVDTESRNFTLGEENGRLVLRVRTPGNGPNGSRLQLETPARVMSGQPQHIIASYGHGRAKLWLNGRGATPPLPLYTLPPFGNSPLASIVWIIVPVFVVMGAAAFTLCVNRPGYLALILSVCLPLLTFACLTAWYDYPLDYTLLAAGVLSALLGVGIGQTLRCRHSARISGGI